MFTSYCLSFCVVVSCVLDIICLSVRVHCSLLFVVWCLILLFVVWCVFAACVCVCGLLFIVCCLIVDDLSVFGCCSLFVGCLFVVCLLLACRLWWFVVGCLMVVV